MSRRFKVTVNGREYDVAVLEVTAGAVGSSPVALAGSAASTAEAPAVAPPVRAAQPVAAVVGATSAPGDEVAQMGGIVVQVDVCLLYTSRCV